jgi:hypothetical protein
MLSTLEKLKMTLIRMEQDGLVVITKPSDDPQNWKVVMTEKGQQYLKEHGV